MDNVWHWYASKEEEEMGEIAEFNMFQ